MAAVAALVVASGPAVAVAAARAQVTTTAGAQVRAAPDGWTQQRQGDLSFALPPGFAPVPAGAGLVAAAAQWTKSPDRGLVVAPAVVVYVENGTVGPLAARATLVTRSRSAEFGVQPSRPLHAVPVPGSSGAAAAEWAWDQPLGATKKPVASRQVEVVVQVDGRQQYGLSLGGPAAYVTDQVVADFLASVAVSGDAS